MIENIKDGLRDLVRAKVLHGWYVHYKSDGSRNWIINPVGINSCELSTDGVIDYVELSKIAS